MFKKRIVVKIGTTVINNRNNRIVRPILHELVRQVAWLYERDIITVLVSSGAIIAGKEVLSKNTIKNPDIRKQVFSAVGQPRIMWHYYNCFAEYGMRCAQVLATKQNFEPGIHKDNMLNCYEGLLSQGIIPITNEDDIISLREIQFSDNDELASLVAKLIGADQLILLSDIDGVYTGDPKDPASKKLDVVRLNDDVEQYIQKSTKKEGEGRGGMENKIKIAKWAVAEGIPTVIARGKTNNIVVDIVEGKPLGTKFIP